LTGDVQIVPFRRRHLDRVLEIERASFGADAWPRKLFLEVQRDCGELFFVAKRARRVAGYMVTCVEGSDAEIVSLAVHPDFRRQGLAQALMRRTMRDLRAAGIRRAELMVRTGNTAGACLYRFFGFRRVGLVRCYYEDGSDGFRMVRAIQ
jgi:ribosomal-protein-alanine N-acetyltransferase